MHRLLISLFLSISSLGFSQYAGLSINLRAAEPSTDTFYLLVTTNGFPLLKETYSYRAFYGPSPMSVYVRRDSLEPATNCLAELRSSSGKLLISEPFSLHVDSLTQLNLTYQVAESSYPLKPGEVDSHFSSEFFAGLWVADSNRAAPGSGTFGMSLGSWLVIRNHLGVVIDAGLGYRQGFLNKDTTFARIVVPGKMSEYYSYFDFNERIRLRFSTHDQHKLRKSGLLFDLGLGYHFPLYFRHVVKYDKQNKITMQGIHQYCDFRAFAGVGFWGGTVFLEYRLFNYIKGGMPEIPPFTLGFKITGDAFVEDEDVR